MKALYFLMPLLMANACKTQTEAVVSANSNPSEQIQNMENECPDGGTCTVNLLKNKELTLKKDGIGALYPEITDGQNLLVEYTYSKKGPDGTVDGNYSETIYFQIPATTNNLTKADAALQDVKLLYGKQCFCRGEAGYYPISNGKLMLEKSNGTLSFDLRFKVEKTSQVVSHISETVEIE